MGYTNVPPFTKFEFLPIRVLDDLPTTLLQLVRHAHENENGLILLKKRLF